MRRWRAFVAVALVAAACGTGPAGAVGTSQTAPMLSQTVIGSPHRLEMCQVLTIEQIASIAGQPAAIDTHSSNIDTCTYAIGGPSSVASSFEVTLRTEDVFEDLATAREAFAGGQDLPGVGNGAYWSPTVEVLWFQTGGRLLAVQLVNFDDSQGDALAIARAVAEAAVTKL
jgi:hypothetical protein